MRVVIAVLLTILIVTVSVNSKHAAKRKCNIASVATKPKPESKPSTPSLAPPQLPVKCPKQTSIDDVILLANPRDCTTFYQCSWGYPYLRKCPADLHFNDAKKYCDWPELANCKIVS